MGWRQPWNNKTKSPGGRTAYEEAPGIKPNETKRNEAKQGERLREMSALSAEAVAASGFKPLVATKSNTSFSNKSTLEGSEFAAKEKNHFLNEQVSAGPKASLHKSLSQGAIAAARDKAEDHSLLKRIPHELATTEGEAGQMLRRVMLHGSSIVFFTPGYAGKRFIYERARDLHVRVVIIDEPGSWAEGLVEDHVCAKFIGMDLQRPSEIVFEDALRAIKALADDPALDYRLPSGICTFCELSVPIAARLAEALGLPGPSSAAIDVARDKHLTRAAMVQANLPSPACYKITSAADLAAAADKVGFPAVLKPLSGAASLGVIKVASREHLAGAYSEVMDEMRSTVVSSGALIKKDPATEELAASSAAENICAFLLEEYLDGPEVDVDVVMADAEARYAAVVDNGPTAEPHFAETWGLYPSTLSNSDQGVLRGLAVDALKACGFLCGVFHVELKLTTRGPRLIEINARMGGGQVRTTHLLTNGVDLVEETLFTAVGIPCRPFVSTPGANNDKTGKKKKKAIAYNYVTASESGVMGDISAELERVAALPGVLYAKPLVKDGDAITAPADGLPTWVADVMVARDTPQAALDFVQELSASLDIPMRSTATGNKKEPSP